MKYRRKLKIIRAQIGSNSCCVFAHFSSRFWQIESNPPTKPINIPNIAKINLTDLKLCFRI